MSHEIVKHRFALTFAEPAAAPGHSSPQRIVMFAEFSSSNNVEPRTYDGNIICHDTLWQQHNEWIHEWDGRIQLPSAIWLSGHAADGGSIKAYPGRNISGTGWISSWQKIARKPIPIADETGRLIFSFSLSVWMAPKRIASYLAGATPGIAAWDKPRQAAWDLLIQPELVRNGGRWSNSRVSISNTAELAAAVRLIRWKPADSGDINSGDSVGIYLTIPDYEGERLDRIFQAMPDPETSKPRPSLSFAPGMVIDLYGHRYSLIEKRKASWLAQKDGRTFRIGPKHFAAVTLVAAA